MQNETSWSERVLIQIGRVLIEATFLAVVLIHSFLLLIASGMKCDESCDSVAATSWRQDPSAWQWDAIGWFGVVSLGSAVVGILAWRTQRYRQAAPIVVGVAVAAGLTPYLISGV